MESIVQFSVPGLAAWQDHQSQTQFSSIHLSDTGFNYTLSQVGYLGNYRFNPLKLFRIVKET